MNDVRKDRDVAKGTGAAAGAVAGAVVGSTVGPLGTLAGAAGGAALGSAAGGALADKVNQTDYNDYFARNYSKASYFKPGSEWTDYEPAYRYGYDSYARANGRTFDAMQAELSANWEAAKRASRLTWAEAKEAVRDGWHYIERALPGDADRDGR